MIRNERGIALVITLLIVALLTITVIEFTYSVEIDQHMARHALSGLQASLLARSGVNLGEALLLHDDDPLVDAYTEDWCPQQDQPLDPDRPSCSFDAANSNLVVPDNMRLRVQILDESGKLNLNMTRPQNVNQWRSAQNDPNGTHPQFFQAYQNVLNTLLTERGVDPQIADEVANYWDQLYQAQYGGPAAGPTAQAGATPAPVAQQTPSLLQTPGSEIVIEDFPSLDDASIIPGFTPSTLQRLRPVLAAADSRRQVQVNVNTASREVLNAIVGEADIVDNIVSQRQDTPLQQRDLGPLLAGVNRQDPTQRYVPNMLGVRSAFFIIRASAIINPNPITGRGGISRTASMRVRRDPRPGVPPNAPPGTPRWTLTQLDWQKEGGAALFQQRVDQTPGVDDTTSDGF